MAYPPESDMLKSPPIAGRTRFRAAEIGRHGREMGSGRDSSRLVTISQLRPSITRRSESSVAIGISVDLVATPDNPIPRRPTVARVLTEDGLELRSARWRPTGR